MTKERFAKIEARASKATPGPWQARFIYRLLVVCKKIARRLGLILGPSNDWADADFIANARTDIPDLIDYVRKLEEKIEQLELLESRSAAEAERLTPAECEVTLEALDLQIQESTSSAEAWEWGIKEMYLAEVREARAARAKIEAVRDGGKK